MQNIANLRILNQDIKFEIINLSIDANIVLIMDRIIEPKGFFFICIFHF